MAQTPIKSDAQGGAGVIRLYPHKATTKALANAQDRLERGENKREYRLTGKEEAFCQCIADGLTGADSIRAAYDVEKSKLAAIYVMANKQLKKPKIIRRIAEIREGREKVTRLDRVGLKAFVIENLKKEALDGNSPGARVRALELIGKLTEVQAFADVSIDRTPTRTEAEIEADIADLLERLRPEAQPG